MVFVPHQPDSCSLLPGFSGALCATCSAALLLLADGSKGSREAERGINCQAEEGQVP